MKVTVLSSTGKKKITNSKKEANPAKLPVKRKVKQCFQVTGEHQYRINRKARKQVPKGETRVPHERGPDQPPASAIQPLNTSRPRQHCPLESNPGPSGRVSPAVAILPHPQRNT